MALIRLSNIEKSFQDGEDRENNVLRGINMEVEKGEFIAIEGPSGSGKTTLLSILGTILRPDSGIYLLDGMEMTTDGIDLATATLTQQVHLKNILPIFPVNEYMTSLEFKL